MRKIWTLALALMMLLALGLPAAAEDAGNMAAEAPGPEEKIRALADLTRQYLDRENLTGYEYFEEDAYYEGTCILDSVLGQCSVYVEIYDDMITVTAVPGIKVPEKYRDSMAAFLTLANQRKFYSHFLMDYEDGEVSSRSVQLVEEVFPSLSEIDTLFYMPIVALDEYGSGIIKVISGADPQQAFLETREEIKARREQEAPAP